MHTAADAPALPAYWSDLTTADFRRLDLARTIAVLPVAATEQHGPHLPLSVDTTIADGIVARMLRELPPGSPVLALPTQAVGFSPEHTRFAGTLTLRAETVMRVWTEIGECVAASGIKKLVIFNTHGGQVGMFGRSLLERIKPGIGWWGSYAKARPPEIARARELGTTTGPRGPSRLYTTSGFGHWFPFRMGCPTEMPIVILERREDRDRSAVDNRA